MRGLAPAALCLALGWWLYLPLNDVLSYPTRLSVLPNLETDAAAYDAFARDFARTGALGALPSKHPPGWIVTLGTVYAAFGHSYVAGKVVSWFALIALTAASAWIAYHVRGRTAAIITALLCASSPGFRSYVGTLQYEVLTAALFAVFLLLVIRTRDARTHATAIRRAVLAGLVASALVLTRETFVLVVPLAALWLRSHGSRSPLAPSAPRLAALLLVVAATPPILWSAAQTMHHGRLVVIADKAREVFDAGNNPLANGTYNEPLVGIGEPAGFAYVGAHPREAVRLTIRRGLYMFGVLRDGWNVPQPPAVWLWRATTGVVPLPFLQSVVSGGWLLIACVAALVMLGRSGLRDWWLLPASASAVLALHMLTLGSFRFAVPLLPVWYVLASVPLAAMARGTLAALRTPLVAVASAVLVAIIVAAQFQSWPLRVTYQAAALDGIAASNQADAVTGSVVRVADAQRGERPIALLPDTYLPEGTVRVRTQLRAIGHALASAPIARIVLSELGASAPCVTDVDQAQLSAEQFSEVVLLCQLHDDSPVTLAVFTLGVADFAVGAIRIEWAR